MQGAPLQSTASLFNCIELLDFKYKCLLQALAAPNVCKADVTSRCFCSSLLLADGYLYLQNITALVTSGSAYAGSAP